MKTLESDVAETQRLIALKKLSNVPYVNRIQGWCGRDAYVGVLCLKNTNVDDWKSLREDVVLAIAELMVPYAGEGCGFCAVLYIVSNEDVWRIEVDSALEEKIWGVVNRHNGALDRCSAKELWSLVSKEATRKGQLKKQTWQYISGPF